MVFETPIRVRFRDTDMYGHVNNSSFATYMEEARIAFLEAHFGGFTLPLILASASYKFLNQTRFPEHRNLTANMWFSHIGNSSATIEVQLVAPDGTCVCECTAVVVHFDYDAQKPVRLPKDVREVFQRYQQAE